MQKFKLILLFLCLSTTSFALHKYYISLIKVDYKKENKSLQITMRIFIDDLQEATNTLFSKNYELGTANESNEIDSLIVTYINDKFNILINEKRQTYQYLGKEYENDVVYIYLEIENIAIINSIEIKNNMLMEVFPNQKNIIKLHLNMVKKTFFLTKENDSEKLAL